MKESCSTICFGIKEIFLENQNSIIIYYFKVMICERCSSHTSTIMVFSTILCHLKFYTTTLTIAIAFIQISSPFHLYDVVMMIYYRSSVKIGNEKVVNV